MVIYFFFQIIVSNSYSFREGETLNIAYENISKKHFIVMIIMKLLVYYFQKTQVSLFTHLSIKGSE